MVVEYSNKNSRFYKLLFYRNFGFISYSIGLLICTGMALYSSQPLIAIVIALLLGLSWTLEYFNYYKYVFAYTRTNKNKRLMIDLNKLTIQFQNLEDNCLSGKSVIKQAALHSHIRNKLPFENPGNKVDKLENFLYRNMNNNKKYLNIWYLEINTSDAKTYIVTPLMVKFSEIPFKDFEIIYDKKIDLLNFKS